MRGVWCPERVEGAALLADRTAAGGCEGGVPPSWGAYEGAWPPLYERELKLRARLGMPTLSARQHAAA